MSQTSLKKEPPVTAPKTLQDESVPEPEVSVDAIPKKSTRGDVGALAAKLARKSGKSGRKCGFWAHEELKV